MIERQFSGTLARVVLNTPESANRFTYALMNDFIAALEAAHASGASVLVVEARGEDFTRGRDQSERLEGVTREQSLGLILRANALLTSFPGVTVAVIQGRAMGFGSGIAVQSTITVAADSAVFGFDEIKHGLAPLVVVAYLPYYIGPKAAGELVASGRDVSAEEALRLGLVNRVAPAAELASVAEAVISEVAGNSPAALRLIRSFTLETGNFPPFERGVAGASRLAAWLAAGKP